MLRGNHCECVSPAAKFAQVKRWLEQFQKKFGSDIAYSFLYACGQELTALKPGNVHIYADGHDLTVGHFLKSAEVCAPIIADGSLSLGSQIKTAVLATKNCVSTNTNLGIILLCAPISQAACKTNWSDLNRAVSKAIESSDIEDAQLILEAIRIASPSGLGKSEKHDVHAVAAADIREIMYFARKIDMIAQQYSNDFNEVFDFGFSTINKAKSTGKSEPEITTQLYLGFLSKFLDSHIVRQHGSNVAQEVRNTAKHLYAEIKNQKIDRKHHENMLNCDKLLKQRDINPGTSADLTVATLFANHILSLRVSNS